MAGNPKKLATWAVMQSRQEEVLDWIARGISQREVAARLGCSQRLVYEYFHRKDIEPLFQRAMEMRAETYVEDMVDIAKAEPRLHPATGAIDGADVANRKLQIDTMRWSASKLLPGKYGESIKIDGKVDVTHHVGSFVDMVRGTRLADESEAIDGESTLIAASSDD